MWKKVIKYGAAGIFGFIIGVVFFYVFLCNGCNGGGTIDAGAYIRETGEGIRHSTESVRSAEDRTGRLIDGLVGSQDSLDRLRILEQEERRILEEIRRRDAN